jgi:hypothetical protein
MGNAASSAAVESAVGILRASPVPEAGEAGEEAFWDQLLPRAPVSTQEFFTAIQPETVRELLQLYPRNVALVLLKVRRRAEESESGD